MPKQKLEDLVFVRRNKERQEALEKIIKPLQEYMNDWCTPHDILIIQQGNAQLYSGELSIILEIRD